MLFSQEAGGRQQTGFTAENAESAEKKEERTNRKTGREEE
jgi:hypothetical protein